MADKPPATASLSRDEGSRFRILGFLGRGGMGKVYKAEDRRLDEIVALKVLDPQSIRSEEAVRRFLTEVRISRKVSHPNVVRTFEFGRSGTGVPYLVMEYVEGRPLDRYLEEEGRLSPAEIARIGSTIAEAIHAAHEAGIAHRDLKPGNVMIDEGGEPHVLDFGVARFLGSDRVTDPGRIVGTPVYMAPEQIQGGRISHRVDIYALGALLYEMAIGRPPFTVEGGQIVRLIYKAVHEAPTAPSQERDSIYPELDGIILRCLMKDPEMRFQSAAAVSDALREAEFSRERPPHHPRPVAAPGARALRVLVTDDSPIARSDFRAKLEGSALEIVEAESGAEAIERCASVRIDAVFLDVMMPEMDGWEVCQILKSRPDTREIPVVILTALEGAEPRSMGALLDADEFLTKPVEREQIERILDRLVPR